jgi:hypothetical protein
MQLPSSQIDDESKKSLLEVKKGKTRKFVMVKDGVQIDKLYVFKKGPHQRYAKQAKQDGIRGEVYWGVVNGDGTDIHFQLSRSDGFTSPPTSGIRLKEFLKEACDLKFEPDFVIVDALPAVDESDDREQPSEDNGAKFVRLLKSILPYVKRALATPTSLSSELETRVREAQDLGRQRQFEQGLAALRIVGDLTKQALAETNTVPVGAGKRAVANDFASLLREAQTKRRGQWDERIAQIEPRFNEAVAAATDNVDKMRAVMDYALRQAARRQFVKALVGLDRLERLIAESL